MSEWIQVAIVLIIVAHYTYFNKTLFNIRNDLSFLNVVITLSLAMIIYAGLEFLVKRKRRG
jgi:hypothetical protein